MTHEMNHASLLARSGESSQRDQDRLVGELQEAVEALERALSGLRELSKHSGYDFVDNLLPGYEWAIDQIGELNTSLIFRSPLKSSAPE